MSRSIRACERNLLRLDMKLETLAYRSLPFIVFTSFIFLGISFFTLPRVGMAPPDPLFPLKIMPIEYWLGFFASIGACIIGVASYKKKRARIFLWISLLSVVAYIYVLPKVMFSNPIWTDTYGFVAEVLHALKYGHIGFGHAVETPALSLFAAQLGFVTGMDHVTLAEVVSLIIPFLVIMMVYFFARQFCGQRASFLAVLAFISFNWFGLYFNRQSFALPLHFLALCLLVKCFIHPRLNYVVLMLMTYLTLVIAHPASSAAVALTAMAIVFMSTFLRVVKLPKVSLGGNAQVNAKLALRHPPRFILIVVLILLAAWLAWQVYHPSALKSFIDQTKIALSRFFSAPSPGKHMVLIGYTQEYMSVVQIRFYELWALAIAGMILSFLVLVATKIKDKFKFVILVSTFFTQALLIGYVMFAHRWASVPFLYLFLPVATLISWFIFEFKPRKGLREHLALPFKVLVLMMVVALACLMPLLMYSHMAFVYPPNSNIAMLNFLAKRGHGLSVVLGGHSDVQYAMFANDASMRCHNVPVPNPQEILTIDEKGYNIVVTNFRVYVKDAFNRFQPSLTESLSTLEDRFNSKPVYSKVYQADCWHKAYLAP